MKNFRVKIAAILSFIMILSLLYPGYRVNAGSFRVLDLADDSDGEDILLSDEEELDNSDVERFIVETQEIGEDELLEDISGREVLLVEEDVKEAKYVSKPASEREVLSVNNVYEDDIASVSDNSLSDNSLSDNSVSDNEIISIELPVIPDSGESPFDFIMDPQGLIVATNAVKYDGASFEEGSTLYFKNTDGEYEYSKQSDWMSVKSKSSVSVDVIVEASIEGIDRIKITTDKEFSGSEEPSIYMAVIDDDGNEMPIDEDGKICFYTTLSASEIVEASEDMEEIVEDAIEEEYSKCSFALTGACNPNGRWAGIHESPSVMLKWHIEPYDPDREMLHGEKKTVDETEESDEQIMVDDEDVYDLLTPSYEGFFIEEDEEDGLIVEDDGSELLTEPEDELLEDNNEHSSNIIRR